TAAYSYDSSDPFRAGQRRGVAARPVDGVVRALRAGMVVFAGDVAGRGVVVVAVRRGRQVERYTYVGAKPAVTLGDTGSDGAVLAHASTPVYLSVRTGRWSYLSLVTERTSGIGAAIADRLTELVQGKPRPTAPVCTAAP